MPRDRRPPLGHPQGAGRPGEGSAAAAVREAREECGLALAAEDLWSVGTFPYRPGKDLSLHAVLSERFDPARCVCTSMFEDRFGRSRPEMDAFRWTPFDEVGERCAKSMAVVLTTRVSLAAILERLSLRARDG